MESLRGTRDRSALNNVSAAGVYNGGNLGTRRKVSGWSSQFSLGFQVNCGVACEWLCARELHPSLWNVVVIGSVRRNSCARVSVPF